MLIEQLFPGKTYREIAHQILSILMVAASAMMMWKFLGVVFNTESTVTDVARTVGRNIRDTAGGEGGTRKEYAVVGKHTSCAGGTTQVALKMINIIIRKREN